MTDFRNRPQLVSCLCTLVCTLTHSCSHPCEFGAHFFSLFDHTSLQHILGTLGVDESVGGVQSLGFIHPLSSLSDVASMLREGRGQHNIHKNTATEPISGTRKKKKTSFVIILSSFFLQGLAIRHIGTNPCGPTTQLGRWTIEKFTKFFFPSLLTCRSGYT